MVSRPLREQDLMACLGVKPAHIGSELVGFAEAVHVWEQLIHSRSFSAAVIQADPPIAGHQIVGFGAKVFVSRAFALDEIANPRPGINDRVIASVASGQSVVLTEAEVRAANSCAGLDLVTLYGTYPPAILDDAQISEVFALLGASFLAHHAGYRIHWMIAEAVDESEKRFLADTHVWRIIDNFEGGRGMAVVTPEDALRVKGSFINPLFHYQEPILRLRSADQELLLAARDGLTDEELSYELGISLPAVKKRWLSLFERTIDSRPDLFAGVQHGNNGAGRGRQKRHHVLAYVRAHPEELRPRERGFMR